jgi:hypothetical protein
MIFKTKDPDVVAYLRACQVRDMVATVELVTDGGKVWGKVVSIVEIAEPEPHWEIDIQTDQEFSQTEADSRPSH